MQRLDVSAEHAVFLDDVQRNVDGACAVGMTAILFVDTGQAIGELHACLNGHER